MQRRSPLRQQAGRVTRFIIVQFVALAGWIVVQSLFSLTPAGRTIPFPVIVLVETVWWLALLGIMFWLFKQEYDRFVRAAIDLEEANQRLREATNSILQNMRPQDVQEGEPVSQSAQNEESVQQRQEH